MEFRDLITEAAASAGLSVSGLRKIAETIIRRGNFSAKHVESELHTFCCKIGMSPYYFRTTPLETIANHIESIMAAEIIAINRGSDQLEVDLIHEREDSATYIINASHGKATEIERRLEKLFPSFRMQSYRTAGIALQSPFRTYLAERPEYPVPDPAPYEDDIRKVASRQFLAMSQDLVIDRYQGVLSRSLGSDRPHIESSDTKTDETRLMISIPASGGYRFISGVSDILNYYGLYSIVKSRDPQNYEHNADFIFEENYQLASTQQRKNKDIPEGGAKGAILLNQDSQGEGDRAFEKYVDGLLDLLLPDDSARDYLGREEILFLGPDEGTARVMDWASRRAGIRGYKFWKAFSTGISQENGGIPHDLYGMTTNSVREYVRGILSKLGMVFLFRSMIGRLFCPMAPRSQVEWSFATIFISTLC